MTIQAVTLTPGYPGMANLYTWYAMANGDSGAPIRVPHFPGKTLQITGTFGVGGNVVIEGSNDGTNWATLTDLAGAALGTITSAGIKTVRENPWYIRPRVSAGDGTTSLVVSVAVICNSQAS